MNVRKIMGESYTPEGRINFLQFLNTVILSVVGVLAGVIVFMISDLKSDVNIIKTEQSIQSGEIKVLQAEKEINKVNIGNLHNRVFALEVDNTEKLKAWVEDNYKRKDQK